MGTAEYVSPEVLLNAPLSYPADLWALGCMIYQMIVGGWPPPTPTLSIAGAVEPSYAWTTLLLTPHSSPSTGHFHPLIYVIWLGHTNPLSTTPLSMNGYPLTPHPPTS